MAADGWVGEARPRGGPIIRASLPHTAVDAFSPMEKSSLGRGDLWGAQGSVIYGPLSSPVQSEAAVA